MVRLPLTKDYASTSQTPNDAGRDLRHFLAGADDDLGVHDRWYSVEVSSFCLLWTGFEGATESCKTKVVVDI